MIEITVAMRAHRTRSFRIPQLRPRSRSGANVAFYPSSKGGRLGVYENVPGAIDQRIVLTDCGLHLHRERGWLSLPYGEMIRVGTEGVVAQSAIISRIRLATARRP